MGVIAGSIKNFYSGGAANSDPSLSLGGVRSSFEVQPKLFGDIDWIATFTGKTVYRCTYLGNTSTGPLDVAALLKLYILQQFTGPELANIAYDPAGIGDGVTTGVATTIANETTAPSGVTFPNPAPLGPPPPIGAGTALPDQNLNPGEYIAVWEQIIIPATGTGAVESIGLYEAAWGS